MIVNFVFYGEAIVGLSYWGTFDRFRPWGLGSLGLQQVI
jgi:hypothetical protein